jgi:hypothetical protein
MVDVCRICFDSEEFIQFKNSLLNSELVNNKGNVGIACCEGSCVLS